MPSVRKCLNQLHDYVPGKSIEEVKDQYDLDSVVKLASNENPLGVSPDVVKVLKEMAPDVYKYPIGHSPVLTEKVAQKTGFLKKQIVFGNGSDEIIWLLCTAFLNPNDKVLTSIETFSEYEFCAHLLDGQFVAMPLNKGAYDLTSLTQKSKEIDPKIIFLCSPNNPTGTLIENEDLIRFLKEVSKDTLVVLDQAYIDFVKQDKQLNWPDLVAEFPNLVLLRTFSKMYGLAGMRVGYAMANEVVTKSLLKCKQPFNVNLMAQKAAETALDDLEFVEQTILNNEKSKRRIECLCNEFSCAYFDTHANFICIEIGNDAGEMCKYFESQGLIVRWLKSFNLPTKIRVTLGLPEEIDLFEKLWRSWRSMGKQL